MISGKLRWQCQAVLTDPGGRYMFLRGLIGDDPLTLASIYAPNEHQDTFITGTLDKLWEFTAGQLILGRDFNVPLIPSSDTSSGHSSLPPTHKKRIANSLHKAQLVDVWRLQHSGERDYTFYSQTHKLYTRIDYFLIPHNQLHSVLDSSIGHITWSDHAPITLTYTLTGRSASSSRFWHLNESLLQNPEVLAEATRTLTLYFQENDNQECALGFLREAHKAVLRGLLIRHGARIKRERNEQLTKLLP